MIEIVSTRTNAGVQLIGECSVFVSGTMFDNTPATRSLRSGVTKINRDARNPFASSLASPVLSDVRQAALEFRTEIGGFGRDLDGHASGFTPIEPRNENRPVVILGSMFSDAGYAGEIFPLPRHRRVSTLFSFSTSASASSSCARTPCRLRQISEITLGSSAVVRVVSESVLPRRSLESADTADRH